MKAMYSRIFATDRCTDFQVKKSMFKGISINCLPSGVPGGAQGARPPPPFVSSGVGIYFGCLSFPFAHENLAKTFVTDLLSFRLSQLHYDEGHSS